MAPRIVLVRTKEAKNIGSAARAMKNFGLYDLHLVAPRCDLQPNGYRLASHAVDVLDRAVICSSIDEALCGCTRVIGTSARPRASEALMDFAPGGLPEFLPEDGGAIVFGPEDFGLSNEELDYCQALVRIPTAEYASLNLAQAVGLMAYEWFRAKQTSATTSLESRQLAPREDHEALYEHLLKALHHIGYTDNIRERSADHLFRRVFARAQLDTREIAALRGLCQQVIWAADQTPDQIPGHRKTR